MTTDVKPANGKPTNINRIGLTQQEYRGGESTLCQGCGHNSITAQIIAAAYDLSLQPSQIIKVSGIGCSSKTRSYGWRDAAIGDADTERTLARQTVIDLAIQFGNHCHGNITAGFDVRNGRRRSSSVTVIVVIRQYQKSAERIRR